jgi:hypothetical protein
VRADRLKSHLTSPFKVVIPHFFLLAKMPINKKDGYGMAHINSMGTGKNLLCAFKI